MKRLNKQGFSMIELLVVLLIIGILAAVAAPLFLANSTKAKLSEAVAGAGEIRSAERTYYSQNSVYLAVTSSETGSFGTNGTGSSALGVTMHGNKYFSPAAYTVTAFGTGAVGGAGTWPAGSGTPTASPVDFTILVTGSDSEAVGTDAVDGASAGGGATGPVGKFEVVMDNTGTTLFSIDSGATWNTY